METRRTKSVSEAAGFLKDGKLVAFPTETVFGLGADARNEASVGRIFVAKGRPSDNPLIVHLSDMSRWHLAAAKLPESADRLLRTYAPGPITVVVPKSDSICNMATAGLDTVGIRVPACEIARAILREADLPVAAPSANRSGRPSCTTWESVVNDLDGRIDAILCENSSSVGLESTVVDCCGPEPILLRPGAITLGMIRTHFPNARGHSSVDVELRRSPGTKHPHYQPKAKVLLFSDVPSLEDCLGEAGSDRLAVCGISESRTWKMKHVDPNRSLCHSKMFESIDEYARGFYEFLREADRCEAEFVLVELAEPIGIGVALRDRQMRAAGRE